MADRLVVTAGVSGNKKIDTSRPKARRKKKKSFAEKIGFTGKKKTKTHKKNIKKNISKLSKFLGF